MKTILAALSDVNLRGLHADAVRGQEAALGLVGPDSGPEAEAWYEAACAVAQTYNREIFYRSLARAEAASAT